MVIQNLTVLILWQFPTQVTLGQPKYDPFGWLSVPQQISNVFCFIILSDFEMHLLNCFNYKTMSKNMS